MTHPDPEELTAFADGEAHEAVVSEHVAACGACRERVESIRALKHAVGRLEGRAPVPEAVRARVDAMALRHRFGARRMRRWALATAVMLGAAAIAAAVWMATQPPSLSEELVADHLRSVPDRLPGEVVSEEPEQVRAFFRDRVEFDPVVPRLPEARLLGGRACTIRGERVQLLFYEHREQTLSLFVFGDRIHGGGCQAHDGHRVCCRHAGERTLMLVGPLPSSELDRLVHEAVL